LIDDPVGRCSGGGSVRPGAGDITVIVAADRPRSIVAPKMETSSRAPSNSLKREPQPHCAQGKRRPPPSSLAARPALAPSIGKFRNTDMDGEVAVASSF
jgi:hypothetical protein